MGAALLLMFIIGLHLADAFIRSSSYKGLRTQKYLAEIPEFSDDTVDTIAEAKTDEERGLTHGYEGDFKVGDRVRVTKSMRIWSVKQYMKEGFDPMGFVGTVSSLALYGRRHKTLCSAITPIRVEFLPESPGIPAGMFEKKFLLHFNKDELERVDI